MSIALTENESLALRAIEQDLALMALRLGERADLVGWSLPNVRELCQRALQAEALLHGILNARCGEEAIDARYLAIEHLEKIRHAP